MHKWLILLFVLSMTGASAESVWTWTDENGQVHYSDRPMPGARRIELSGAQSIPASPPRAQPQTASLSESPSESDQPGAQPYRTLNVLSPSQQETLWNIGGSLDVAVELAPPLRPGHRLDVYLDGERMNVDATTTRFTVPEVWRGVHSMQVVVVDGTGRELLRSLAVTFMVQQTSIQNPNNPNVPRLAPPQSLPGR